MWNLETWYDEPMTIETQTENEQVDMGRGGMWNELGK